MAESKGSKILYSPPDLKILNSLDCEAIEKGKVASPSVRKGILTIEPLFDCSGKRCVNHYYKEIIYDVIDSIFPCCFLIPEGENVTEKTNELRKAFLELLPIFKVTPCQKPPSNVSFFSISPYRPNAFSFFFEMISHWLVPGKRLNVLLVYAVDFRFPDFGNDVYTLCEVMLHIDHNEEFEELRRNLPIIESEVRMGLPSSYYARRILEVKGVSADTKTAMVQEFIASLITRQPKEFDYDLLTEMQHVFVLYSDEFKAARKTRHLSRIIYVHYLFRKALRSAIEKASEKRHLSLKLMRATLHFQTGDRNVLGILVGINFLSDKEIFEERHLISAIQHSIPSAKVVEKSFLSNRHGSEHICTIYLEIEKADASNFTDDEIKLLRRVLPNDLKARIEHVMHPIFMPRNDEEIMRNIFSLSNEIKHWHDQPQVIISFEQQMRRTLFFTIILVRVRKPGSPSIQEVFQHSNTSLEYIHDRAKTVGYLRKKYAKEAVVFGVKIPKHQFLRKDFSIDLNLARQAVVKELVSVLGEFRDFNGGMITRQNELLFTLRKELDSCVSYNSLLLENFFYSLMPDAMRTVVEPEVLKILFLMLLESIKDTFFIGENYSVKVKTNSQHVFAIVKTDDPKLSDELNQALNQFEVHSGKLARSTVSVYEASYTCHIFFSHEPEQQQLFISTLNKTLKR